MKRAPGVKGFIVTALATVGFIAACGSDRPPGATDGVLVPPGSNQCATPNDNCPCDEPGKTVECGKVTYQSGDFVACEMGHRTCRAKAWGPCEGTTVVTKSFVAGNKLRGLALGTSTPCDPATSACNPYCQQFVDDPSGLTLDGGVAIVDGGIVVTGTSDGGGADASISSGEFETTFTPLQGGVTQCTPDRNVGAQANGTGAACVYPDLGSPGTCQQDFRCDPTVGKCIWNGGPGYKDPTCSGVDLTIGAPLGPQGSAPPKVPLCNRGTASLAAGSPITITEFNGSTPPNACTVPPSSGAGSPTRVCNYTLPFALQAGACVMVKYCANSTGTGFITVNNNTASGSPVAECTNRCGNNAAYVKTDGCGNAGGCTTTITGKVYDPSATTTSPVPSSDNNLPLAGITVFQPAGPLVTFPEGVHCDSCESLQSPSQTAAVTNAAGAFTLTNVSPGPAVPITVQTGRWRRTVTMNVPRCTSTPVPRGVLHLPKDRSEGDIPRVAMVTGKLETLSCMLRRVGIAASEWQRRDMSQPITAATNADRFHMFRDNGNYITGTSGHPTWATLNPTTAAGTSLIDDYNAVIFDCPDDVGSTVYSSNSTQKDRILAYANAGGRVFMDHWPANPFIRDANAASGWPALTSFGAASTGGIVMKAQIVVTPGGPNQAAQQLFRDWLDQSAGASVYGVPGFIQIDQPRQHMTAINSPLVTEWINGRRNGLASQSSWNGSSPAPDTKLSASFETPINAADCGVANGHGRVFYNGMHVANARGNPTGRFDTSACSLNGALTAEELALSYQIFQLTACQVGGAPPPPPPQPPPPLTPVTFTRDYQGVCPLGHRVRWGFFQWQATIPPNTSIEFQAAQASTATALPPPPPPGAPASLVVGNATTTVVAPSWAQGPSAVDTLFGNVSNEFLRVYITLNPQDQTSPTLHSWRQLYDCIPAE